MREINKENEKGKDHKYNQKNKRKVINIKVGIYAQKESKNIYR